VYKISKILLGHLLSFARRCQRWAQGGRGYSQFRHTEGRIGVIFGAGLWHRQLAFQAALESPWARSPRSGGQHSGPQ